MSVCLSTLSHHPYLSAEMLGFQTPACETQMPRALGKGFHSATLCSMVGEEFITLPFMAKYLLPSVGRLCCRLSRVEIKIKYEPVCNGPQKGKKA